MNEYSYVAVGVILWANATAALEELLPANRDDGDEEDSMVRSIGLDSLMLSFWSPLNKRDRSFVNIVVWRWTVHALAGNVMMRSSR